MKYLIVGSGGTGGCIGGFLAAGGKNVTFIARNAHLKAMKEKGFLVHTATQGDKLILPVQAFDEESYQEKADVIFVCVKSYSVQEILPLIRKASHEKTIVIPILNVFGIGDKIAEKIHETIILDGCIYISAFVSAPGEVTQAGNIFKIVYGVRKGYQADSKILLEVKKDLEDCGIEVVISDNIKRDTFKKYTFISSYASTGAYYDAVSRQMQEEGEIRDLFLALNKELKLLGEAMGLEMDIDTLEENKKTLARMVPESTASMQKDMKAGKKDERDEIIFEVLRLAEKYHIHLPQYEKVAKQFGYQKMSN